MRLSAGDWVEVRTKDEILATLDPGGRLDGMPFMPQMFGYCGKRFRVHKRAHKTCDTVSGRYVGRALPGGVHLDQRCDGAAYGGCQAACQIFWKEAWLKPIQATLTDTPTATQHTLADPPSEVTTIGSRCTEEDVLRATRSQRDVPTDEIKYTCQATELLQFTSPLKWWDARQYVEDYTSGNNSLTRMARGFVYFAFTYGTMAKRRTLGRPARWLYDQVQFLRRGIPFPRRAGHLKSGDATPAQTLNLQPGDVVRVKAFDEIRNTIDTSNLNRGMSFDAEMVPYCGRVFRVKTRITQFVDEKTGYLRHLKTPAVILEGAYCQSRYSENRLFCPRNIYIWWREIWLERVADKQIATEDAEQSAPSAKVS